MLKGLRLLLGFMATFWAVFMAGAWIVAEIYLPWVKTIASGVRDALLVDFLTWLVIVILIALILLAFKYLLHAIFWRVMADTRQPSP